MEIVQEWQTRPDEIFAFGLLNREKSTERIRLTYIALKLRDKNVGLVKFSYSYIDTTLKISTATEGLKQLKIGKLRQRIQTLTKKRQDRRKKTFLKQKNLINANIL